MAYGYGYQYDSGHGIYREYVWDAQIYAPGALGNAAPVSIFKIGSCESHGIGACISSSSPGLALDSQGDLRTSYWAIQNFSRKTAEIGDWASPISGPVSLGDLTGSGAAFPNGLTVDSTDELYVDNPSNDTLNPGRPFIAAFPAGAIGHQSPDRVLEIKGAQSFGTGIDVSSIGLLYIPDTKGNALYVMRSSDSGVKKPLGKLSVPLPLDAKVTR